MSLHGNWAFIGQPGAYLAGQQFPQGAAHVYKFDSLQQTWIFHQSEAAFPDGASSHTFGSVVEVKDSVAVITDLRARSNTQSASQAMYHGNAFLYKLNGAGNWYMSYRLEPTDPHSWGTKYGTDVEITDNYIFVAAENAKLGSLQRYSNVGAVHVFKKNTAGAFQPHQILYTPDTAQGASFGSSLAANATKLIVGARNSDTDTNGLNNIKEAGAVYYYKLNAQGDWVFHQKFISPNRGVDHNFGFAVALQNEEVLVGEPGFAHQFSPNVSWRDAGATYLYHLNSAGNWQFSQQFYPKIINPLTRFGASVFIHDSLYYIGASGGKSSASGSQNARAGSVTVIGDCDLKRGTDSILSCGPYRSPSGKRFTQPGNYIDTIHSHQRCDSVVSFNLQIQSFSNTFTVTDSLLICKDQADTYQWLDCNFFMLPISGATGKEYRPTQTGSYAVVTTKGNCSDTTFCMTFINNISLAEQAATEISIYPNPAKEKVFVTSNHSDFSADNITLRSPDGQLIRRAENIDYLELSDVKAGVYILTVEHSTGKRTFKLILQ